MSVQELSRTMQSQSMRGIKSGKPVMTALANFADADGMAFPGLDTLARYSDVDRRTVIRVIERLEAEGHLYVQRGAGRGKRNNYVILVDLDRRDIEKRLAAALDIPQAEANILAGEVIKKRGKMSPFTDEEKVTKLQIKGDKTAKEKVTKSPIKGDKIAAYNNVLEPIKEPINSNQSVEAAPLPPTPQPEPQKAAAAAAFAAAVKIYEEEISGAVTPLIAQEIEDWLKDAPAEFVELAIKQAARSGNRRWSYVVGILRRCQQDNWREKPGERKPSPSSAPPPRNGTQMPGVVRKLSDIKRRSDQINRTPIIIEGRIGDA